MRDCVGSTYLSKSLLFISLLAALLLFSLVYIKVSADNNNGERFKEITSTYTEYTWQMTSILHGNAICTVSISHTGPPTTTEAYDACAREMFPEKSNPYFISSNAKTALIMMKPEDIVTTTELQTFLKGVAWLLLSTQDVTSTEKVKIPDMIVDISAPLETSEKPYIIIRAYEPYADYQILNIEGTLGGTDFICHGAVCEVPIQHDTQITFWADSTFGDQSPHSSATVRVVQDTNGFRTSITERSNFVQYQDAAHSIWSGVSIGGLPSWAQFPLSPFDLNTNKKLHYLAGKLISQGYADASSCPGGGFLSNGAPNACGLEASQDKVLEWQNRFDMVIWEAAKDYGIPAKLIKSVIELESQYWPQNARYYYDEYGLGQVNELGIDVLLRWDNEIYSDVCSSILSECPVNYSSLSDYPRVLMRGKILQEIDAVCPSCEYGVDINKAEDSIELLTRLMRANVIQTGYILKIKGATTSYEDMWKFTMVSYHSGYLYLDNAINETIANYEVITWENVSQYFWTDEAVEYVNALWDKLAYVENDLQTPLIQPVIAIIPTATPLPTPTKDINIINGQVEIVVYTDLNNNIFIDKNEKLNNEKVEIKFADGELLQGLTDDGVYRYNFSNKMIGSKLVITIPSLYLSESIRIPENGQVFYLFRIEKPEVPKYLP